MNKFAKMLLPLFVFSMAACSNEQSSNSFVSTEESTFESTSITSRVDYPYPCDFRVDAKDKDRGFVILQISDPQVAFAIKDFDSKLYKFIDKAVEESDPDLIFVAGDIVYGRYDEDGSLLNAVLSHINDYNVPWAPIFGNHDNESPIGIDAQCKMIEGFSNSLFKRRSELSGNGNYSIGCFVNDELVHVMYCLDTKGCAQIAGDKTKISAAAITTEQVNFVVETQEKAALYANKDVKGIVGTHIMSSVFTGAIYGRYKTIISTDSLDIPDGNQYGDFGNIRETFHNQIDTNGDAFYAFVDANIDGWFSGHHHQCNAVIKNYDGITIMFGLKSSIYDFYDVSMLGGTKITVDSEGFSVEHIYVSDI